MVEKPIMYNTVPIHIVFCVNDAYVRYVSVSIKSIVENNRNCHIHVLTDCISASNRKILHETIEGFSPASLYIYEVDDTPLRELETGRFTIYAWYRLLIPDTLPNEISRVLYLDADTVVTDNLEGLLSLPMDDKAIAGVPDPMSLSEETYIRCGYDSGKQYLCSGVLLMNLGYWRKHRLADKIIDWAKANAARIKCPDQDAINFVCQDDKLVLPLRYNVMNYFFLLKEYYRPPYIEQLKECLHRPAIIHYAGWYPWIKDKPQHCMCNVWLRYNNKMRRPAGRIYHSRGLTLLKIRLWDLFHPKHERISVTTADVERKLLSRA